MSSLLSLMQKLMDPIPWLHGEEQKSMFKKQFVLLPSQETFINDLVMGAGTYRCITDSR